MTPQDRRIADMLSEFATPPQLSEAYEYGARAVPFVYSTKEELAEWFLGFAEACCAA